MSLLKKDESDRALVHKAQASYVPLKRPAVVLEEDEYIDGLSDVIKRQFFPDLVDVEASGRDERHATRRPDTPQSYKRTPAATTDGSQRQEQQSLARRRDLTLSEYQTRFTSEDNADFLALLDKQNLERRSKHAWQYDGNVKYTDNTKRHMKRLTAQREQQVKAIGYVDDRLAAVDGWEVTAKNALMFDPEPGATIQSTVQDGAITVNVQNTRLPDSSRQSQVDDEVNKRAGFDENDDDEEEPMVNGYGFIEEPDTPLPNHPPVFHGPKRASDKPNPFKIAKVSDRDRLHESLLAKTRASSTTPRASPSTLRRTMATPKFKTGPVLSSAAQRLMTGDRTPSLRDRLKTPLTKR